MDKTGWIDLHVHGMPSLVQRMNPWDYILEMEAAGYRACVVQDHSASTAGLAYALQNSPRRLHIQVYGTLVMNAAAGGIHAACVEAAHRMGVRRVSFPTTSSPRQTAYLREHHLTFGGGALNCPEPRVSPLDEEGRLTRETLEVLDYAAAHPDLILSTGYMGTEEIEQVVSAALECGCRKVLVDHPYAIVEAPLERIKRWAGMGAYIELTAANFKNISVSGDMDIEKLKPVLEAVTPGKAVLSSDFGQLRNGSPVEGLERFAEAVRSFGYSEEEMEMMTKRNAAHLLFEA